MLSMTPFEQHAWHNLSIQAPPKCLLEVCELRGFGRPERGKEGGRLYTWFVLYRRMRQVYCGLVQVRHLFVTLAFTFILQYEIAGSYTKSFAYDVVNFELSR